jgi:phosphorylcholine metabolism protein LicD
VADTVAAFQSLRVRYWADYGTLLGAVRNPMTTKADYPWLWPDAGVDGAVNPPLAPGIIPHDKDADFGVFASDWAKLMQVRAALERKGYYVQTRLHHSMLKVCLSAVNRTALDLFAWREKANGQFMRPRYISVDQYKGRDIPKGMLLPLGTVEWEGMQLAAPVNPEAFCAFRYGPTWRTPIAANHDGRRR